MSEKLMGILSVIIAAGSVVVLLLTVTGVTVLWRFCKRKYKCCRELDQWRKRSDSRQKHQSVSVSVSASASASAPTAHTVPTAVAVQPASNPTAAPLQATAVTTEKDMSSSVALTVEEASGDSADANGVQMHETQLKPARSDSDLEQTTFDKIPAAIGASNKSSTSLSSSRSQIPVINVGSCGAIAHKSQAELSIIVQKLANEQQSAGEDERDSGLASRLTDETDCTASPETTGDSPGAWRAPADNRQRSWSSRDRMGPRGCRASPARRVGAFSSSVSSVEPQSATVVTQQSKFVALWMRKDVCDADVSQERKFAEMWRSRRQPRANFEPEQSLDARAPRLLPTPVPRRGDALYRSPPNENETFLPRLGKPENSVFAPAAPCNAAKRWLRQRDNIVKFRSQSDVRGFQTLVTQALDNERSKKRQLPALPCSATSASIHLAPESVSDYHPVTYTHAHTLLKPSYEPYRYNYQPQPPSLSNQITNFEMMH